MAERFVIRRGDTTTTGGRVLEGSPSLEIEYAMAARLGDPVLCPLCGVTGTIAEGNPTWIAEGRPVAGAGHTVACGCPPGANRLVAGQFTVMMDEQTVAGDWIPPEGMVGTSLRLPSTSALATLLSKAEIDDQRLDLSSADEPLEEEEEEEEWTEPGITLRLGLFFDGTGNNRANSEAAAGCRAEDLGLSLEEAEAIRQQCSRFGYDGEGNTPDNSYGNDVSNIARLYELYVDHAYVPLPSDAKEACLKVYLEGIGTTSGQADSLGSQATGQGGTGVLARVDQAPALILEQLRLWRSNNPSLDIQRIEFDLFGFSRGAAAARHCANDLLKGAHSLLARVLPAGTEGLSDSFAWRPGNDFTLNFIGLFDTVPGVVAPLHFDFSPHNARNPDLNLRLEPGAARQVVQLVAENEHRHNFSLVSTDNDIRVPGAHSDIGGGYFPEAREKLLLSRPDSSTEALLSADEASRAFLRTRQQLAQMIARLEPYAQQLGLSVWSRKPTAPPKPGERQEKRVYAAVASEREVRGELSLVYLRIMRELAVRGGVPFDAIDPSDSRTAIPAELLPIATKLQAYALGTGPLNLSPNEQALLRRRYIHLSAHWNAAKGWNSSDLDVVFINRPAEGFKRAEHANE